MNHLCHAHGCAAEVKPRIFMCRPHWFSLRKVMQRAIWREYREGQEVDKQPSKRYLAVQRHAVGEVCARTYPDVSATYLRMGEELRQACIAEGLGDPLQGLVPREASR